MQPADFAYASAEDLGSMPIAVSIFADRPALREEMREDALVAGLSVRECVSIAVLVEGEARPLGEVLLVDVPVADAAGLAALARLDMRAAHAGAQLVVVTSVAALEDVFGCCDHAAPQILVDPTRAERVLALGRARARAPGGRLRERPDSDRLALLRIADQVERLAERLDLLGAEPPRVLGDDLVSIVESPPHPYHPPTDDPDGGPLMRATRPSLPDPRLVRRIIRQRQLRGKFFDPQLFADPAWDILLDLTAARAEHKRVSVTSLCIASGVPPTTALRWIGQMTDAGLLERVQDDTDRRRAFVALGDKAARAMSRYFAELGRSAKELV